MLLLLKNSACVNVSKKKILHFRCSVKKSLLSDGCCALLGVKVYVCVCVCVCVRVCMYVSYDQHLAIKKYPTFLIKDNISQHIIGFLPPQNVRPS